MNHKSSESSIMDEILQTEETLTWESNGASDHSSEQFYIDDNIISDNEEADQEYFDTEGEENRDINLISDFGDEGSLLSLAAHDQLNDDLLLRTAVSNNNNDHNNDHNNHNHNNNNNNINNNNRRNSTIFYCESFQYN